MITIKRHTNQRQGRKNIDNSRGTAEEKGGALQWTPEQSCPRRPPDIPPAETELPINCGKPTRQEIRKAIQSLKNGRATGPDDVPAEALKVSIGTSTEALFRLFETGMGLISLHQLYWLWKGLWQCGEPHSGNFWSTMVSLKRSLQSFSNLMRECHAEWYTETSFQIASMSPLAFDKDACYYLSCLFLLDWILMTTTEGTKNGI